MKSIGLHFKASIFIPMKILHISSTLERLYPVSNLHRKFWQHPHTRWIGIPFGCIGPFCLKMWSYWWWWIRLMQNLPSIKPLSFILIAPTTPLGSPIISFWQIRQWRVERPNHLPKMTRLWRDVANTQRQVCLPRIPISLTLCLCSFCKTPFDGDPFDEQHLPNSDVTCWSHLNIICRMISN